MTDQQVVAASQDRGQVDPATLRPGLREHPAHALVKINDHPVPIASHDDEVGEQPPRRQIFGNQQPSGGFIHVHPVWEQFKAHDLAGQAGAHSRLGLWNQ